MIGFETRITYVQLSGTAKTIENCWRKSGLLPAPEAAQPEPANDADVEQLRNAIGELQSAAQSNLMIPAGEELVNAEQCLSLDGENKRVHQELGDEELIQLVNGQNTEILDSDESDDKEVILPQMKIHQAVEHAIGFEIFLSARPDVFSAEDMSQLCMLRRKVDKMLLTTKKQVDTRSLMKK